MAEKHVKLFVHALLSKKHKEFLRAQVPEGTAVLFLDEIAEPSRQAEFATATHVYGNPPAAWFAVKDLSIRWMQLYSAGFSEYQQLEKPIPVSNMHGYFARPCAETVVAGILALYRKIDELALLKSRKEWVGRLLRPQMKLLQGKSVILLGAGTISMAVNELLSGFRCRVSFYGRTHPAAALRNKEDLFNVLPETDILVNTLPGTAETHHFVSADLLKELHPAAIFVNIGRGSTVDQEALVRVLLERRIGGAVLDVYEEEPLPAESPLWKCPNTILSQHTGGGSAEEERGKVEFFLANLDRVLKEETPLNLVDIRKGY